MRTSKRDGTPRICARPMDPEYEPWTKDVVTYFERFDPEDHVFPFTRQKLGQVGAKAFKGLWYPIEEYDEKKLFVNGLGEMEEKKVQVPRHFKPLRLHGIRHIVATELMYFYGFNLRQLSMFTGWSLKGMTGASPSLARYAHMEWTDYFPKLLKKR